jgi:hypothetical protein
MDDYIKVTGSAGTNGFYPVPGGSSLSSGQAVVTADKTAKGKVIPALPAIPDDEEWYRVIEAAITPTNPTTPTAPASDLDENISFTGQNISDAPSTNPSIMTLSPRLQNGEMWVTMTFSQPPAGGEQRWIMYNNLRWFTQAQIEARGYALGREHNFQCFDFSGQPAGNKRTDQRPNAEQRLTMF